MVLAIGAACGVAVERFVESQKRAERRAYWQGRNTGKRGTATPLRKDKAPILPGLSWCRISGQVVKVHPT